MKRMIRESFEIIKKEKKDWQIRWSIKLYYQLDDNCGEKRKMKYSNIEIRKWTTFSFFFLICFVSTKITQCDNRWQHSEWTMIFMVDWRKGRRRERERERESEEERERNEFMLNSSILLMFERWTDGWMSGVTVRKIFWF